jgi:hypothetical protein
MSEIHSKPEERDLRSARKKRLVGAAAGAMEDREYQRTKK